jgi:acyl transferase domain-containing protein
MACDAIVRELAGWSVAEQLSARASRLDETAVAQVAIAALQFGLTALWRSYAIEPAAVVGHSMGEVVAAHIAGALDRADALRLLLERGRIAEQARGGAMASVGLPGAEVDALLADRGIVERAAVAAINSPHSAVVSGDPAAVAVIEQAAVGTGAPVRRLPVQYGFHSPLLDGCDRELAAALAGLRAKDLTIPLYSTVTGRRVDSRRLDAAHWGRNLREAVLFRSAIERLAADGISVLVEVGPHPVLLRDISETLVSTDHLALATMRRDRPVDSVLYSSLAALYVAGAEIRWPAVLVPPRRHVPLPSYPWQRRRYWLRDEDSSVDDAEDVQRESTGPATSLDHTLYVRECVSAAAGLSLDDVPEDLPLETLGLSSLSIVELRNQVSRELGIVVPLAALLGGGTAVDLAQAIRESLGDSATATVEQGVA